MRFVEHVNEIPKGIITLFTLRSYILHVAKIVRNVICSNTSNFDRQYIVLHQRFSPIYVRCLFIIFCALWSKATEEHFTSIHRWIYKRRVQCTSYATFLAMYHVYTCVSTYITCLGNNNMCEFSCLQLQSVFIFLCL